MNKQGFIRILIHGRKQWFAREKFLKKWYDPKTNNVKKGERVSCCYAFFYDPRTYGESDIIRHVTSEEHIIKLVAKRGFNDPGLIKEVNYYALKIINGEANERSEKDPDDLPF